MDVPSNKSLHGVKKIIIVRKKYWRKKLDSNYLVNLPLLLLIV